jgi:cytochrome d ubiquinol oxidase subunit II
MLYILQHYWWLVVSLLGAILVFLLFVQGGQTLLFGTPRNEQEKTLLVNAFGHKWEYTFTTLVTFGGAMFASFPLYYSTSFGSAYWLWITILFLFVLQAVSYEFRTKAGNLFGHKTYETFLYLNGLLGTIFLGIAVGTFFTGGPFVMDKMEITNIYRPVISYWTNHWHGLDVALNPFNLLMGIVLFLVARTLGLLFVINHIDNDALVSRSRIKVKVTGVAFVLAFVGLLVYLSLIPGYAVNPMNNDITMVGHKYMLNYLQLKWPLAMLLAGVVLVLTGLTLVFFGKDKNSFYITGGGVVLAVWSILIVAAFNNTAYFVSTLDPEYSLTLYNSSSSEFTLKTMAVVSILIPFVLGYIIYAWRSMTRTKLSNDDIEKSGAKY